MEEKRKDKMLGALFGQAVGDALGMGAEFMSKEKVHEVYPSGLRHYSDIKNNAIGVFRPGDYTDDTEMMEHIVYSLNKEGKYDLMSISQFFRICYEYGP